VGPAAGDRDSETERQEREEEILEIRRNIQKQTRRRDRDLGWEGWDSSREF
jgi:hypothetical protein